MICLLNVGASVSTKYSLHIKVIHRPAELFFSLPSLSWTSFLPLSASAAAVFAFPPRCYLYILHLLSPSRSASKPVAQSGRQPGWERRYLPANNNCFVQHVRCPYQLHATRPAPVEIHCPEQTSEWSRSEIPNLCSQCVYRRFFVACTGIILTCAWCTYRIDQN